LAKTGIACKLQAVADPKILKGGWKTIYQPRPHLLQMHTTIYGPFSRKKGFLEKNWANRGAAAPTATPSYESATDCKVFLVGVWPKTKTVAEAKKTKNNQQPPGYLPIPPKLT